MFTSPEFEWNKNWLLDRVNETLDIPVEFKSLLTEQEVETLKNTKTIEELDPYFLILDHWIYANRDIDG